MSVLKIRDENGNIIEVPVLKGDDYILTDEDKVEIANIVTQSEIVGDIKTALDGIIAIQNELIGGESV